MTQFYRNSKYILPVRADICREITKRRVYSHRKDEVTGKVKKRKNPKGTSSPFGWGTVTDTFMLNPKIWDNVRRNLELYVKQIDMPSYLEKDIIRSSKRPSEVEPPQPKPPKKSMRIASNIEGWYEQCQRHLKSGSIGLVPDCYANRDTMPPLEEIMLTQVGQVLQNYNAYLKSAL